MLEFEEYKSKLNAAKPTLEVLRGALKLEAAQKEIEELEAASERPDFWNDVENSQKVQKRLKTLKNKCENYQMLCVGRYVHHVRDGHRGERRLHARGAGERV